MRALILNHSPLQTANNLLPIASEVTYSLERFTDGDTWYYAWCADGWWISGYPIPEYIAKCLTLIKLLSLIGTAPKSDREVAWASNHGVIDEWCQRTGRDKGKIGRIVTYSDVHKLYGMTDFTVYRLHGWDADFSFKLRVMDTLLGRNVTYKDARIS